ncbi:hypothetical protein AB0J83_45425 [Actinoplanes sp. NPDC049596]|uniref:hypothetical protein n=1 Tax=unclassified Actinoplanes TaxID=2626549 RepID=UPI0034481A95
MSRMPRRPNQRTSSKQTASTPAFGAAAAALGGVAILVALATSVGSLRLASVWVLVALACAAALCVTIWYLWIKLRPVPLLATIAGAILLPSLAGGAVWAAHRSVHAIRCADSSALIENGKDQAAAKELDRAVSSYAAAICKCPSGRASGSALGSISIAIELNSRQASYYFVRGRVYAVLKDFAIGGIEHA